MTGLLEFSARAALCRQLARREPDSKNLWLAEAESWSRLTLAPHAAVVPPEHRSADGWDAFEAFLSDTFPETAQANRISCDKKIRPPSGSVSRTVE